MIIVDCMKKSEIANEILYEFSLYPETGEMGLLKIDKETGDIEFLQQIDELVDRKAFLAIKKYQLNHPNIEEYPEKISWQS